MEYIGLFVVSVAAAMAVGLFIGLFDDWDGEKRADAEIKKHDK